MNQENKPVISIRKAVITGLIIDFLLLLLSSVMMDCGVVLYWTFILMLCHWITNILLILYKKSAITQTGKNFIRFGLLIVTPIIYMVSSIFGRAATNFLHPFFQ